MSTAAIPGSSQFGPTPNLREALSAIRNNSSLTQEQKAEMLEQTVRQWHQAQIKSPLTMARPVLSSLGSTKMEELESEDKQPSYHDEEHKVFGCKHYQRNFRIRASCCGKWVACRMCHDDQFPDHKMDRYATREMLCLHCRTEQPIGAQCTNEACGQKAAYYCDACKYINDDPKMNIFHCSDCGLCRVGKGLGKDFFHCKTCNICLAIGFKGKHKCVERSLESDCPVCCDYMFTSVKGIVFLPCGHGLHQECLQSYVAHDHYTCPICCKSIASVAGPLFRAIDEYMASTQMPPEYQHFRSTILCNDCLEKSKAAYHMAYHMCSCCGSYNTKVLEVERRNTPGSPMRVFTGQRTLNQTPANQRQPSSTNHQAASPGYQPANQ